MDIRFDFNNMMDTSIGEFGFSERQIDEMESTCSKAVEAVQKRRGTGWLGWMELPYQPAEELSRMKEIASRFQECKDFVVLGIGGSALGTIALKSALLHPWHDLIPEKSRKTPRLHVLDNVDPYWLGTFTDVLDPSSTCVNVISKSGSTAETMSQFLWMRKWLKENLGDSYAEHIVVTTDPVKGALRAMAEEEGFAAFTIPEGVGGRFSVLSPVGLFPASVMGIDVGELLSGAAAADEAAREENPWSNQALMMALLAFLSFNNGRNIWVMMPYVQGLKDVADWFRQLWAESLGKAVNRHGAEVHVGQTPVKALGTTDQHSQVQLYIEGPQDKVIHFIGVEDYGLELEIPSEKTGQDSLDYLGGHTFNELIKAEREATALALAEAGRPNCTHILPSVTPFTLGELLFTFEMATAYSGELYDIDAFDQPGVEAGKVATYALLGRPGYESRRRDIEKATKNRREKFVIDRK